MHSQEEEKAKGDLHPTVNMEHEMKYSSSLARAEALEQCASELMGEAQKIETEARRLKTQAETIRLDSLPDSVKKLARSPRQKRWLSTLCGEGVRAASFSSKKDKADLEAFAEKLSAAGWPPVSDPWVMQLDFSLTAEEREAWKALLPGWLGTYEELLETCREMSQ